MRNGFNSIASARRLAPRICRPRAQVVITLNTKAAISNVNQPPDATLTKFDARNITSIDRKKSVGAMHSHHG